MSSRYESLGDSVDNLEIQHQKWIYKQLEKRVTEYSVVDKVTIMCLTWNVNAKIPGDSENLKQWLLPDGSNAPDIYAIGLQEIVDLNVVNIVVSKTNTVETAASWVNKFAKILNSVNYYKVLLEKTMVGTMLVIFVKASLHACIRDVKFAYTYTGSYGTTGNKGGVSISMKIHDSPVCFVCAHFHANRDAVQLRNSDYTSIVENTVFTSVGPESASDEDTLFIFPNASDCIVKKDSPSPSSNASPLRTRTESAGNKDGIHGSNGNHNGSATSMINPVLAARRGSNNAPSATASDGSGAVNGVSSLSINVENAAAGGNSGAASGANSVGAGAAVLGTPVTSLKKPTTVLDHEYVFWFGDLNYRLDEEVELLEIFERLRNETWETLREQDQLLIERAKLNVFHNFKEGTLSFPPTYKYQPGSDLYETRPDKKLRAPAWCDRVLWRSMRQDRDIILLHYQVAPLHMSDHKPVSASFICNTRKIMKDKLKSVYGDLLMTVDKWVNASKPKIEVEGRMVDFGPMKHMTTYKTKMLLKNTGKVMAEWHFVPKNDQADISKRWLKLSPMDGILAPEETMEVEVTAILSLEEAYDIATTKNKVVDDIVILSVPNGSDFFCIINGQLSNESVIDVCSAYARISNRRSARVVNNSDLNEGEYYESIIEVPAANMNRANSGDPQPPSGTSPPTPSSGSSMGTTFMKITRKSVLSFAGK